MSRIGITHKLSLVFTVFAATIITGLGILFYQTGRAALEQGTIAELFAATIEKQAALNDWIEGQKRFITNLSASHYLIEDIELYRNAVPGSPDANVHHAHLETVLNSQIFLDTTLESLLILDHETGQVLVSSNLAEEGSFQNHQGFFQQGKNGPYLENTFSSFTTTTSTIVISAPIVNANGEKIGILAGRVRMNEIEDIIKRSTGLRSTFDAFLINTNHFYVTQPRFVFENPGLQGRVYTPAVNRCLERKSGHIKADDYRGVPSIIVHRWLPENQLCLIVKISQEEAFGQVNEFRRNMLVAGSFGVLLAMLLSSALSKTITVPLRQLHAGAVRFGQGKFDTQVPETSTDELGSLAKAFNQMAATLADKDTQLRAYAANLECKVAERTQALARANEMLEIVFSGIELQIAYMDRDFNFIRVNEQYAQGAGHDVGFFIGKNHFDLYPHSENEKLFRQVVETGEPYSVYGRPFQNPEFLEQGVTYWDWSLLPIRDTDGRVDSLILCLIDVTKSKQAEEKLEIIHTRLQRLMESNIVGIAVGDEDGGILEANGYYLDMVGYTRAELEAGLVRWIDLTPPHQLDLNARAMAEMKERGVCTPFEKEYIRKDGTSISVFVGSATLPDEGGKVISFVLDISERKRIERAVIESEARFHTSLETMLDGFAIFSSVRNQVGKIVDFRYEYINQAGCQLNQMPVEAHLGKTIQELLPAQKAAELIEQYGVVIETHEPMVKEDLIHEEVSGDGKRLLQAFDVRAVPFGDGVAVVWRDITVRINAEKHLKEVLDFNQKIISATDFGVLAYRNDGQCLLTNQAAANIVNGTTEQLLNQNFKTLSSWEKAGMIPVAEATLADGQSRQGEFHIYTTFGRERWFQVYFARFISNDLVNLLLIINDITDRKIAEGKLRESEQQYRELFNGVPLGLYRSTSSGKFLNFNPMLIKMLGYPDETSFLSTPIENLYDDPKERDRLKCQLEENGAVFDYEVQFRKYNGEKIWVRQNIQTNKNSAGDGMILEGVIEDITTRKLAELALREREETLAVFLNALPESAYLIDPDGTIRLSNQAFANRLGEPKEKVIGACLYDLLPQEVANGRMAYIDDVIRLGLPVQFEDNRSGRTIYNYICPVFDEAEKVRHLAILGFDITDRKLAEQSLKDNEELLRTILELMPVGVWFVDSKGSVVLGNSAAQEIWGGAKYVSADEYGEYKAWWRKDGSFIKAEDWPVSRAIKYGESSLNEMIEIESFDGLRKIILNSVVPIRLRQSSSSVPIAAVVVNQEVTNLVRVEDELRKKATELARSNRELESLAYVASHDLQEPLRMVTSYLQLIERRYKNQLDSNADEFIAYAVDGAERMKALINDLLAYSRVGTHGKEFQTVDCNTVLQRAMHNLQLTIEESGAEIICAPLPKVTGNEGQLVQLFQNLISNGIKFRQEERPRISISAENLGDEWQFTVKDNGIGIDPQFNERIFIIFQRLHGKTKYEGTGIGLAVAKKIVELHNGRIWVESQSGEGSTFYFTMRDGV